MYSHYSFREREIYKTWKLVSTRFICNREACLGMVKAIACLHACARKVNGAYSTAVRYATEYEKPLADRGDVAKANKVPAKQHDRTDEARHLTMYYSNRFITGIRRCDDESLLLSSPLSHA